jgi:hypothetical protein
MPAALWDAAVAAAKRHGLYATVRALRVDYGALKKHLDAAGTEQTHRSAFVEFAPTVTSAPPCVIEIEGRRGTVRIRLAALALDDITALAHLVWGPR